jgi:hypothetical protein
VIIALLLVVGLGWWLHKEGILLPNLRRFGVAGGAAVVAVRLLETGQVLAALAVAGGGAYWWHASAPRGSARADPAMLAAARTLGVAPSADADAIHAAWRRVIAQAHPDRGGTDAHAAAVTAARDLLLRG